MVGQQFGGIFSNISNSKTKKDFFKGLIAGGFNPFNHIRNHPFLKSIALQLSQFYIKLLTVTLRGSQNNIMKGRILKGQLSDFLIYTSTVGQQRKHYGNRKKIF